MDQIVSRSMIFDRGAAAFDKGLGIDDHNMNIGVPAIADWQAGWRSRQAETCQQFAAKFEATPP